MSRQALVDEIFEELASGSASRGKEKRRHARKAVRFQTEALIDQTGNRYWVPVTLRDISPAGAGMICSRMFYAGEYIILRLEFTGFGQKPKHVLSQVRSSRYCGHRLYHIGIEFKDALHSVEKRDFIPESWLQILHAAAGGRKPAESKEAP